MQHRCINKVNTTQAIHATYATISTCRSVPARSQTSLICMMHLSQLKNIPIIWFCAHFDVLVFCLFCYGEFINFQRSANICLDLGTPPSLYCAPGNGFTLPFSSSSVVPSALSALLLFSLWHPSPTNDIFILIPRMAGEMLGAIFECWQTKNKSYFNSIVKDFRETEGGIFCWTGSSIHIPCHFRMTMTLTMTSWLS